MFDRGGMGRSALEYPSGVFRNMNVGQARSRSPRSDELLDAFASTGAISAVNFQTNGTVIVSGDDPVALARLSWPASQQSPAKPTLSWSAPRPGSSTQSESSTPTNRRRGLSAQHPPAPETRPTSRRGPSHRRTPRARSHLRPRGHQCPHRRRHLRRTVLTRLIRVRSPAAGFPPCYDSSRG